MHVAMVDADLLAEQSRTDKSTNNGVDAQNDNDRFLHVACILL